MIRRGAFATACALAFLGALALVGVGGGSASAEPLVANVKPDATLSPGQTVVFKNTTPHYGAEVLYPPHSCRGDARTVDDNAAPLICTAYRIVLNLDPNPKAQNTVIFEAIFNQTQLQSLPLVATGLNPPPLGGVNVYVYDQEDHYLGENSTTDPKDEKPGGASFNDPELGSFTAKQRIYDITVQAEAGPTTGFDLHVTFSNEIFTKPLEVLDQYGNPKAPDAPPDVVLPQPVDNPTVFAPPTLQPASVAPDSDIAGIGLGVNEQFDPGQFALPPATRSISTTEPPSTLALVAGMVAFPFVVGLAAVLVMRRRRQALVA
ncbi:MAG: hypothetical protein QOG90_2431 [Actinomycetota bacterium]